MFRSCGSLMTGQAASPHRNIHFAFSESKKIILYLFPRTEFITRYHTNSDKQNLGGISMCKEKNPKETNVILQGVAL